MMRQFKRYDWKLRELLLYVSARDQSIAATKLNKILYHADTGAYLELGEPITGHPYMHRKNGPAPKDLLPIRKSLLVDGSATLDQQDIGMENQEVRIVPLREANTGYFRPGELALVDQVIDQYKGYSGDRMAKDLHLIPGFLATKMNDVIPYETAWVSADVTEADREWAQGAAERQ